ncbi:MAG: SMI1/KNR4 family protein [Planctomycetes bacterium]|nr:SMI1/KNR4 family protein [Planctomycetota bacterium]
MDMQGRRISSADLHRVEEELGVCLPNQYREFLLESNGGHPRPNEFMSRLPRGNDRMQIRYFLSALSDTDARDLVWRYRVFCEENTSDLLPIADVADGSMICIGVARHNQGAVYFHDYYAGFAKPHPAQLGEQINYRLYDSFAAFISSFVSVLESEVSPLKIALAQDDVDGLSVLLDTGQVGLEDTNVAGHSLMEQAAIRNACGIMRMLFEAGVPIGRALELALKNAEFSPKHQQAVSLVKALIKERNCHR